MTTRGFLEQVADYFMTPGRRSHLEDYVFVFPNRRSGRFLKRYMQQRISGTAFMPRFMTVGALMARLADRTEASQRECIFELYDAYREALAAIGNGQEPRDFDKFIFWGEMILADFDEIDRNGVNARELYTNLGKLREISADYLDEEQKAVVREIWGEDAAPESIGAFWRHIGAHEQDMVARFLTMWSLLAEMYERFSGKLAARRLATAGMQYRDALRRLRAEGRATIGDTTYVFVGFNAPSVTETLIFSQLKTLGAAEFFWDTASPYIQSNGRMSRDSAAFAMLGRLVERFPMPPDFALDKVEARPEIEVVGVPSRTAQAKLAGEILAQWIAEGHVNVNDAIETAVIMPDESLLMPMLHSLPPELKAVNITMGLPFAGTAFAALLKSVVSMQMRARKWRGVWRFYHEDILEIVAHPHLRTAAGKEGLALREHIVDNNLYTMSSDELTVQAPRLAFIFNAVDDPRRIGGVRGYLTGLLDGLHELLVEAGGSDASWEIAQLGYLRKEIDDLARMVEMHGVEAGEKSYFALFERALHSRTITMAGTPLKGMQIMSVAETRGLDFDNVLIMSMNERIFPQRSRAKTMIPNNLRAGYGLPPTDRAETESAYYFYRLIARARRVVLLYDSRDVPPGTGEASRFITQLRYMHAADSLRFRSVSVGANPPEKREISVAKTPAVLKRLDRFRPGGKSYISASALKTFKHCGLKFYLQYVCGMRGEDEVTDYITSAVYGTILHGVAQDIYEDYKDRPITAAVLTGLSEHMADRYTALVERWINKEYYHREAAGGMTLPVEGQIVRDLIIDFLKAMFAHERKAWCPTTADSYMYCEGEKLVKGAWQITPDVAINFKMYIDRVDRTAEGLRFIDYKTGGDKTEARNVDDLLKAEDFSTDAIMQILTYCEAYSSMEGFDGTISPVLYTFRTMEVNDGILQIVIGGDTIADYRQVSDAFLPQLQRLVGDIFDPEKPFAQAKEGSRTCSYCVFASMCGRVPRDDN